MFVHVILADRMPSLVVPMRVQQELANIMVMAGSSDAQQRRLADLLMFPGVTSEKLVAEITALTEFLNALRKTPLSPAASVNLAVEELEKLAVQGRAASGNGLLARISAESLAKGMVQKTAEALEAAANGLDGGASKLLFPQEVKKTLPVPVKPKKERPPPPQGDLFGGR